MRAKVKKSKELKAFELHRNGATKDRGIPFEFTFEEWVGWWRSNLGDDWISKRGRRKHEYVMARKGDKGPYAPWNVDCKTQSENAKEQTKKVRVSKLSEADVRKIYLSRASRMKLARAFGVGVDAIHEIKQKHSWKHITDVLD